MLISSAKAKATKASAKAKDLCTKLVEATKLAAKLAAPPLGWSAELVASTPTLTKRTRGMQLLLLRALPVLTLLNSLLSERQCWPINVFSCPVRPLDQQQEQLN
jgi:hypothetical protein